MDKGMKHKKFWDFIKNYLGYWTGLISGILGICSYFKSTDIILQIIFYIFLGVFLIVTAAIVISKFLSIKTVKKVFLENQISLFSTMHKVFHSIRDYANKILKRKSLSESDLCEVSNSICNNIESFYRKLFNRSDVGVCIKLLDVETISNTDFENWQLKTLSRSSSHSQERCDGDTKFTTIEDNTDFYMILSPKYDNSYFAEKNMIGICDRFRKENNVEYRNSRTGFINYYKSTIVVPIRIRSEFVSEKIKIDNDSTHHILGFLCIDSMHTFDEDELIFNSGVEVAKSIGDSLYHLYENYLVRMIELKEKGKGLSL
ncbi:MAG: hypothetical protein IKU15_06250 [Clostridia bacterium]|nr:hypothetical protein [Clostridia bacterium]